MITIYYTFVNKAQESANAEQIQQLLPPAVRNKIVAYTSSRDRTLRFAGKWLLGQLLGIREAKSPLSLNDLLYDQWGKPYFPKRKVQFSITHSGNLAVCALADNPDLVGIDVEQLKSIALADVEDYLTQAEQESIKNAADPMAAFYHLWTRKEAILKASGNGVGTPFHTLDVLHNPTGMNGNSWHWYPVDIAAGYVLHLASNYPQTEIIVKELELPL